MTEDLALQAQPLATRALVTIIEPFVQFLFPTSLIWWPFLLTTLAVAMLVFWLTHGRTRAALREFRHHYLSRNLWLHPSARADYAYFIVNGILYPPIVGPLIVAGATIASGTDALLTRGLGPLGEPILGPVWSRVLYTVAFFIAYDFGRFAAHSLQHAVPALWQFHKVHHSAEVLTPFTNYRVHPVDLIVMTLGPNVTSGLVSGLFWYLSGGEVAFYTFFGLHVGIALFNTIGNLRHWQIWISFGPWLNRWFISPAHHQIHHSKEPRHWGKNCGFELAIWDRLFGTLYAPEHEESFAMGLADGTDGTWHRVSRMY